MIEIKMKLREKVIAIIKEGEEKKERVMKNPENSLAVYDTKAEGWRSFVIRNIKSVNTSPRL